jgi:hypothetical protein
MATVSVAHDRITWWPRVGSRRKAFGLGRLVFVVAVYSLLGSLKSKPAMSQMLPVCPKYVKKDRAESGDRPSRGAASAGDV